MRAAIRLPPALTFADDFLRGWRFIVRCTTFAPQLPNNAQAIQIRTGSRYDKILKSLGFLLQHDLAQSL
jgi:hypothetical protein